MSEREWRVTLLRDARRYLEKLPPNNQDRILDALTQLEQDPFATRVKPLQGRSEWSPRVGEYRILVRVARETRQLVATRISPRGDVYKR